MDAKIKNIISKHLNNVTYDEWYYLYNTCELSLIKLSKLFGVTHKTIRHRLIKFEITLRSSGKQSIPLDRKKLKFLYEQEEKKFSELAKEFKCAPSKIKKELKLSGANFRKSPKEILTKSFLEEQLAQGQTPYSIANLFSYSPVIVYRYLYKYGFKKKFEDDKIKQKQQLEVIDLYEQGLNIVDICKLLDKSQGFVSDAIVTFSKPRDSNSNNRKVDYDLAVNMYNKGKSLSDIVSFFGGGSKTTLAENLRKKGCIIRTRSESLKGKNNHMTGSIHSIEAKQKMSDAFIKGIRNPPEGPRGNVEVINSPMQGEITVKSSWEAAVARYLNNKKIKYFYEDHSLSVFVDNITRSYTPDFCIINPQEDFPIYIEVKGVWTNNSYNKVKAALNQGYDLEVWDKVVLQRLGIINTNGKPLV